MGYLDALINQLNDRMHLALKAENRADFEFFYKLAAVILGLSMEFGERRVELILSGAMNLDMDPSEIVKLDKRTPVV